MVGTFACPECATEVEPAGLSPGREVTCPGCGTRVEVPFLPRVVAPRGRRAIPGRTWACIGLGAGLALLGAIVGAWGLARLGGPGVGENQAVAEMVAASEQAEQAGDLGRALADAEAAWKLSHGRGPRLDELARRRDRLSLAEARARLAALAGSEGPEAFGEALTLLARARANPALDPLRDEIEAELARRGQAEVDAARAELAAGRGEPALARCERALTASAELPLAWGGAVRDGAWEVAGVLVARLGVVLDPVQGRFALGNPRDYAARLGPVACEAMTARGYLPRPASSPFAALWDRPEVYHLAIEVHEAQDVHYLDSRQLATRIDGLVTLNRRGRAEWEARLNARTRRYPPALESDRSSRALLAAHRDEKVERLLYEDARAVLIDQVASKLQGLPDPPRDLYAPPGLAVGGRPATR